MTGLDGTVDGGSIPAIAWSYVLRRALLVALTAALLWAYWGTLLSLYNDWQQDDNYSVGQLVPFAALYLIWHQRAALSSFRIRTCWWGAAIILAAQVLRGFGMVFLYESAERYSFLLTVYGIVVLLAGWEIFCRVLPVLLFLLLMVPLPGHVHNLISAPLQDLATVGAVAALELLGTLVEREGHVMVLNESTRIAVAEACSGLRMLTAFLVVTASMAMLVRRPAWQKVVLLLSNIPIAIFCNLVRLVVTAELYVHVGSAWAERFFHDFAGWVMMPMAVLLLAAELVVMGRLIKPTAAREI